MDGSPAPMWTAWPLWISELGIAGGIVLLVLGIMAFFAPLVARHDPIEPDLRALNQPPTTDHILGTDSVGRDNWARLVYGARVSLSVGSVAVSIYISIGVLLGGLLYKVTR